MKAIFDTNLFVAAGFKPHSASASLIALARSGAITLIWDSATQAETRTVLTRIPPVSWEAVADVFHDQNRWHEGVDLVSVAFVTDPQDRKFAALSMATGATLVSSDSDVLDHRGVLNVCTPSEFLAMV